MATLGRFRVQWVDQPDKQRMRAQVIGGPVRQKAAHTQDRVYHRARRTAPKRTGTLSRSHRKLPLRNTPAGWVGEVVATARHARIVHDGRGPVFAKRARALRFRIRGRIVFARSVGPAKAQPWLRRALVYVAGREGYRVTPR